MDFIEEVKFWVSKAREADPELKLFGASKHKYQFAAPVSLTEVRAFEQKHDIKLPENYVRVLTELGNGGAGPYYGLYPLDKILNTFVDVWEMPEPVTGKDETFIDDSLTPEKWSEMNRLMDEAEDDAAYDLLLEKCMANAVMICDQGCTYESMMMCSGSANGKIFNIEWSEVWKHGPKPTHMTFEEWYLGYFREVAAKNKISWYGYYRLGTEEELIAAYEKAADLEPESRREERLEILSSLDRFRQLSSDTISRLIRNPDDSIIASLIYLILHSDKATGLAMFDERFYGDHPEKVILMCRSIPDESKDKYYQRALEILYSPEISERPIPAIAGRGEEPCARRLLFFLGECSCRSAKDLISYAKSGQNPDECRGTAAYVICECPDVSQYQEEVAELMHSSVYPVAFNAMQGADRAKLREPVIMDAFRWMKEHYRDDQTIQNNLERIEGL